MTDLTSQRRDTPAASCDVLIVDDNTFLCDLMTTYLTQRGLVVRSAPAASSALALLDKMSVRVAILDYHLPGQSGIELAQAFRDRALDLPIIMMSTDFNGPERKTLEKLGVRSFVNKPVPLLALYQAIVRLMAST